MERAVSIPPLNMTPEQLAKALLRPVDKVQEATEDATRPQAPQQMIQEQVEDDPEIQT